MFSSQAIKRCLVPSLTAAAVEIKLNMPKQEEQGYLIRPSELPLYTPEQPSQTLPPVERSPQLEKIENTIRTVRVELQKVIHEYKQYKKVGSQEFHKRKENLDWVVNYLQEENNTLPKIGAISIGGLTGFIFGLRGGFIKRTLYAAIGALGISAVCYPKEAAEYGQIGLIEGKKYMIVSYNFVTGAKKDDPPPELPSIPIPGSAFELWDSVKKSVASFVTVENANLEEKVIQSQVASPIVLNQTPQNHNILQKENNSHLENVSQNQTSNSFEPNPNQQTVS